MTRFALLLSAAATVSLSACATNEPGTAPKPCRFGELESRLDVVKGELTASANDPAARRDTLRQKKDVLQDIAASGATVAITTNPAGAVDCKSLALEANALLTQLPSADFAMRPEGEPDPAVAAQTLAGEVLEVCAQTPNADSRRCFVADYYNETLASQRAVAELQFANAEASFDWPSLVAFMELIASDAQEHWPALRARAQSVEPASARDNSTQLVDSTLVSLACSAKSEGQSLMRTAEESPSIVPDAPAFEEAFDMAMPSAAAALDLPLGPIGIAACEEDEDGASCTGERFLALNDTCLSLGAPS